jgi:hypothetical protein
MPGESEGSAPLMVRGSIVTTRRRCGTASCRCARGELHEGIALSLSLGGKTTLVTLKDDAEVAEVAAALDRYRVAAAELEARVQDRVQDSLVELRARLAASRSSKSRA